MLVNCQHFSEIQWKSPRHSRQVGISFWEVNRRGRSKAGLANIPSALLNSETWEGMPTLLSKAVCMVALKGADLKNRWEPGCHTYMEGLREKLIVL